VRSLLLAVVLPLLGPGVAGAAVTPGDYGGGALKPGSKVGNVAFESSWMWARVGADGRARIGGRVDVGCGLAVFDAEAVLAQDGAFQFARSRRWRSQGHRLRAVVTVRGRFDGAAAAGTVVARLRNRHPNGRVRHCATRGRARWQLRQRPAPGPPAPPRPRSTYLGLTSQAGPVPRPFLLRVNRRGSRVQTSVFEYTRSCPRKGAFFLNDVTPGARIRPDSTFTIRERFTLPYFRNTERFRIRVDGQFAGGAVTGTLRVTTVWRKRGSGRVVDRCDTGPLTFAASL
jgi:hypothetical protein